MSIIHTADLHLDSPFETNFSSIKMEERKREILSNVSRLVEYAKLNNVDRIIIAGDLFDGARILSKTRLYLKDIIINNPSIDFFFISGNHDEATRIFEFEDEPKNLKRFGNEFKTYNYPDCDITGINYKDEYDFSKLNLNKDKKNILILHGDINSNINLKQLKNKNIDYLALGHIHKYEKGQLDDRGIYAYSGALEGRGFDETGPKGFILLDIKNEIETSFIPFAKREIHNIEIDISKCETYSDIRKLILDKICDIKKEDMLYIRLIGKYNIDLVKQNDMLNVELNDQYYFVRIKDDSKLKINIDDYKNDISLKGEFIRNVLNSDLKENEKAEVIEYGIKALLKEEIL